MTDDDAEILDAIERWVDREVRPIARQFDHADEYPAALVEQMKELGLFGATIAKDYGGSDSPPRRMPVGHCDRDCLDGTHRHLQLHLIMAACVERFGTEQQKQHFLPSLRRVSCVAASG